MATETREQFEERYAKGSGMTVEHMHRFGMHVEPCDCGDDECTGWQMTGPGS